LETKLEAPAIKNRGRYLVIFMIALVGGFITKLPYLSGTFYTAIETGMGLTREQIGLLGTMYGLVNFILYIPGGVLADRFSYKKLVIIGGLSTAALGFLYATLPQYAIVLLIFGAFAITTVFIFWAAMIKAVNNQGGKDEQGRMFGTLEGMRYFVGVVATLVSAQVFAKFVGEDYSNMAGGLQAVIVYYSILLVVSSGLVALFLKEPGKPVRQEGEAPAKVSFSELFTALKYPKLWMCGLLVFCNYFSLMSNYSNPYFQDGFGLDPVTAANLTTYLGILVVIVSAFIGGIIADKIGSRVKFYSIMFVGMSVFSAVLPFIPRENAYAWVFFAALAAYCLFGYAIRALYFATLDDINMPKNLAGSASSVISLVGYLPEIFTGVIIGGIMDQDLMRGYNVSFAMMFVPSVLGIVLSILLLRMIKKDAARAAAPAEYGDAVYYDTENR